MDYLLGQLPRVGVRQNQHLLFSVAMQQAFRALQMPVYELEEWLKNEIEQNPVLEYQDETEGDEESLVLDSIEPEIDFEKSSFEVLDTLDEGFETALFPEDKRSPTEVPVLYTDSLFEHLMAQASFSLSTEEKKIAETLVGNLDHRGFLSIPLSVLFEEEDIKKAEAILEKIQTFDPPGIAAQDLKQSLLLQLRLKGKEKSLAFRVIECHFDDLIHNRLPHIQKAMPCSQEALQKAIYSEIAGLDLHPGSRFSFEPAQPISPDLLVHKEKDKWIVEVSEESLPSFRVAPLFLETLTHPEVDGQEKLYLRRQIAAGKWLQRIVKRRHTTLKDLGELLVKKHASFLNGDTKALAPLTMQEAATTLELHESTIARAVAHKYLFCRQGLLPLRSFFSQISTSHAGEEISSQAAKELLLELVQKENKNRPLSDDALAKTMHSRGIPLARRTIAKYRQALAIAPASQRRRWP